MKITIDSITEQQLEDMIEIVKKINKESGSFYWKFYPSSLTLRAQETFRLIRNQ